MLQYYSYMHDQGWSRMFLRVCSDFPVDTRLPSVSRRRSVGAGLPASVMPILIVSLPCCATGDFNCPRMGCLRMSYSPHRMVDGCLNWWVIVTAYVVAFSGRVHDLLN